MKLQVIKRFFINLIFLLIYLEFYNVFDIIVYRNEFDISPIRDSSIKIKNQSINFKIIDRPK